MATGITVIILGGKTLYLIQSHLLWAVKGICFFLLSRNTRAKHFLLHIHLLVLISLIKTGIGYFFFYLWEVLTKGKIAWGRAVILLWRGEAWCKIKHAGALLRDVHKNLKNSLSNKQSQYYETQNGLCSLWWMYRIWHSMTTLTENKHHISTEFIC